jgi:hypothetical protein
MQKFLLKTLIRLKSRSITGTHNGLFLKSIMHYKENYASMLLLQTNSFYYQFHAPLPHTFTYCHRMNISAKVKMRVNNKLCSLLVSTCFTLNALITCLLTHSFMHACT